MNYNDASIIITPNGYKAGKLYALKGDDLNVVRATSATRVNASGLIELVGANVPRLDYSNGSCPSILVEPQRTNLNIYSEDFINGVYTNQNITISANSITAPDGTDTADKLIITGSGVTSIYREVSTTSGNYYTTSVYVKKAETQYVNLGFIYSAGIYAGTQFDLNNGTIKINNSLSYTGLSSTITSVGNGWYRLTVTCIINTATAYPTILPSNAEWTSGDPRQNLTGDNTIGAYFWGLQMELGSYATSYIPTTSASVTRNADLISKTGISSLIGQTEGTMFCEIQNWQTQLDKVILALSDGSFSNYLQISSNSVTGDLQSVIFTGGVPAALGTIVPVIGQNYKIAIGYKLNDYAIYINGTQVGTFNSKAAPSSLTRFDLGSIEFLASNYQPRTPYKVAALWKTRLTNTELASLTTI